MPAKEPHAVRPRPIDAEKTERQMKGLDGDAIVEEHERAERAPHEEVFEAPEAEEGTPPASDKKVTPT